MVGAATPRRSKVHCHSRHRRGQLFETIRGAARRAHFEGARHYARPTPWLEPMIGRGDSPGATRFFFAAGIHFFTRRPETTRSPPTSRVRPLVITPGSISGTGGLGPACALPQITEKTIASPTNRGTHPARKDVSDCTFLPRMMFTSLRSVASRAPNKKTGGHVKTDRKNVRMTKTYQRRSASATGSCWYQQI